MYNSENWYWIVGGNEERVYSSLKKSYVPVDDEEYMEWRGVGRGDRIFKIPELVSVEKTTENDDGSISVETVIEEVAQEEKFHDLRRATRINSEDDLREVLLQANASKISALEALQPSIMRAIYLNDNTLVDGKTPLERLQDLDNQIAELRNVM